MSNATVIRAILPSTSGWPEYMTGLVRDGGLEHGAEPDPGLGVEDEDGVPGVAGPVSALQHPKLSSN